MKKSNRPLNLNKKFEFLIKSLFFTLIFSWFYFNNFSTSNIFNDFFALSLSFTALLGLIYSIYRAKDWGFTKSLIGKSLIFFSFGLFMWFLGQSFYFLDTKISNPIEIYDFFFIFIDPFYLIGLYYLATSIGTFKYLKANISLLVLPILIFVLNLIFVAFTESMNLFDMFLNFELEDLYIFGSIILATFTICILIFSKKIGGLYKTALYLLLFGILFQFLGDNLYAYLENQDSNGSAADLLFFMSVSLITYSIYKLDPEKLNE